MEKKVGVIIVTYNRLNCLKKLLQGLEQLTYPIEKILVFDNNSTDNTVDHLRENGFKDYRAHKNDSKKLYFANDENLGGAGGFSMAVGLAQQLDIDYLWIMDDDVLPEPDCLEKLLMQMDKTGAKVALPSREDENYTDRVCLDLDLEDHNKFWASLRKQVAPHPLDKETYFVKDMTFEGPLMTLEVSKKVGLPDKDYFIFFDDTDYAYRLSQYTKLVYVTDAKLRRQLAGGDPDRDSAEREYTWRNYYMMRNNILFDKRYGKNWKVRHLSPMIMMAHMLVLSKRNRHLKHNFPIIMKAWYDGIRGKSGKRVDPNY